MNLLAVRNQPLRLPAQNRAGHRPGQSQPKDAVVTLQPIAMRIPNRHGIYSPSKIRPQKQISYEDFLSRFADYSRQIRVCFDEKPASETLLANAHLVTAYGSGLDCWYIVAAGSDDEATAGE